MNDIIQKAQFSLEQASTFAVQYDTLYNSSFWMAIFFTVLIFTLVIFFSIKYRRTSSHQKSEEMHGHTGLEIFWSAVPLGITMIMFFWGAYLFFHASNPPKDAMEIYGVGKQWMWKFQHPTGQREINHLHVPLGKPVKVTLTSEDVIHSFFVPAFRVKMDAVPGRYTSVWFEATKKGEFHLFCAEFCGTEHSLMVGKVVVMEPDDYEAWTGEGTAWAAEPSLAEKGKLLYDKLACAKCHNAGMLLRLGPSMKGIYGKKVVLSDGTSELVDEEYLRESLLYPNKKILRGYQPLMPTYKELMTEEEIVAIIAYIKSLGHEEKE